MEGGSELAPEQCQGMDRRKQDSEVKQKKEAFLVSTNSGSILLQQGFLAKLVWSCCELREVPEQTHLPGSASKSLFSEAH